MGTILPVMPASSTTQPLDETKRDDDGGTFDRICAGEFRARSGSEASLGDMHGDGVCVPTNVQHFERAHANCVEINCKP